MAPTNSNITIACSITGPIIISISVISPRLESDTDVMTTFRVISFADYTPI